MTNISIHMCCFACATKSGALTLLAEDGWGWVLAVSSGRRRCLGASGRFPTVQTEEQTQICQNEYNIYNKHTTRYPNSTQTPWGYKCLCSSLQLSLLKWQGHIFKQCSHAGERTCWESYWLLVVKGPVYTEWMIPANIDSLHVFYTFLHLFKINLGKKS